MGSPALGPRLNPLGALPDVATAPSASGVEEWFLSTPMLVSATIFSLLLWIGIGYSLLV